MKKGFVVLTIFIFALCTLPAATHAPNVNLPKPMKESPLASSSINAQSSSTTLPDRQNYLAVDFTGLTTLPTGWTVDVQAAHWAVRQTNEAGGVIPELRFDWSPSFNGTSRFISPVVDLTGINSVNLEFMQMLDHYASPYTIGVATRSNSGTWNTIWSLNPDDSVSPELKELAISNLDVGSSTFQICFYFTGNSYNINDWYIDNIRLFTPWPHDVKIKSIDTQITYPAGGSFVPPVVIANVGTNSETFNVNCKIFENTSVVYDQTVSMYVAHGAMGEAPLPMFAPATVNEIYRMEVATQLEGDQDTSNDTMMKYFNTYATDRQKVMLEIGTGTWCQYCPGAAMGADDLVTNGKQVAVVEYHNGDNYTNDASNARNTYYNITGFPTGFFDGTASFVGGSHTVSNYAWYLPIYEAAYPLASPFYLSMTGALDGLNLTANVNVKRFGRITPDALVLHFAIIENGIQVSWQGQTHLEFVERAMLPDYNGTALDISDEGSVNIPLTTALASTWNVPNLELVCFIQNPATKVIYQGFVLPITELVDSYVPSQPLSLQGVQNGGSVNLSWNVPAVSNGLSGFMIYRDDSLIHTITHPQVLQYTDVAIVGTHTYIVKALFGPSISASSNALELNVVGNNDPSVTPSATNLIGNYPNPFTGSTTIRYHMSKDAKATLAVYNIKGQLVRTLENDVKSTGTHEITWDGKDNDGNKLASGIYIYQFNSGNVKQTQKAIMLK